MSENKILSIIEEKLNKLASIVCAIALNPPVQATFPDLPVEQWS